jgi:hypothetical protein
MLGFFKKNDKEEQKPELPSILGLAPGFSFELDALCLKLAEKDMLVDGVAKTQIIQAVGIVDWDECTIFRFYTDDEAFLQVVANGGTEDHHVVDVKLFHYYDTLDVASEQSWNELLSYKIGASIYSVADREFERVWTCDGDYHQPVHMREKTYDEDGSTSITDQFVMLFERAISNDETESLFVSAEEVETESGNLERCLVLSTGMSLTPSDITIHG